MSDLSEVIDHTKPKRKRNPSSLWGDSVPVPLVLIVMLILGVGCGLARAIFSDNLSVTFGNLTLSHPTATFLPPDTNLLRVNTTYISPWATATPIMDSGTNDPENDPNLNTRPCTEMPSNDVGKFVFRIWLQRSMELFRADEDWRNLCHLTHDNFLDDQPAWSPNGDQIAFVSDRDGYGIYIMEADGSNKTKLTGGGSAYSFPEWSPDGGRIVFQATINEKFDLYVINVNGTNLRNLTNQPRLDTSPAWSPDGHHIVFASDRTYNPFIENRLSQARNYEIYLMDQDGLNVRRLTSNDRVDVFPEWSPDNSRIAFSSDGEIMLINPDGSGLRRLTDGMSPVWLSNGEHIAFIRGGMISVMDTDGGNIQQISDLKRVAYLDFWTP